MASDTQNPCVFLGGTCADSGWREELIPHLKIEYFHPIVEEWDDAAQQRELDARENSEFCLYVLSPRLEGFYSIAEVVDDSNKRPEKTIFCYLEEDGDMAFTSWQIKSLNAVGRLVSENGATWCRSLKEVAEHLNKQSA